MKFRSEEHFLFALAFVLFRVGIFCFWFFLGFFVLFVVVLLYTFALHSKVYFGSKWMPTR